MSEGWFQFFKLRAHQPAAPTYTVSVAPPPEAADVLPAMDEAIDAAFASNQARDLRHMIFLLEWGSTLVLLAGVALTAFNIYPLNLWVSLVANIGWMLLGVIWKKWSLFVVEIIISAVYVVGIAVLYGWI